MNPFDFVKYQKTTNVKKFIRFKDKGLAGIGYS
jgi:hypothetical protein